MTTMLIGSSSGDGFTPSPPRTQQIVSRSPGARGRTVGISPHGPLSYNLWDCTAGRLRWVYRSDEILHILEGSATLQPEGEPPRKIGPGDVVYLAKGLVVHWEIESYIKKLAICRSEPESLPRRVLRALR